MYSRRSSSSILPAIPLMIPSCSLTLNSRALTLWTSLSISFISSVTSSLVMPTTEVRPLTPPQSADSGFASKNRAKNEGLRGDGIPFALATGFVELLATIAAGTEPGWLRAVGWGFCQVHQVEEGT
jgi:hypothetical protein